MEEDYNWTQDGDLVKEVMEKTWIPFAQKHGMKYEHSSIESNKLHTFSFVKNDLLIKIMMSRTSSLNLYYYSQKKECKFGFVLSLFEFFLSENESIACLYDRHNLPIPNSNIPKEDRWMKWINNYIFLLEFYCSELLDTGDICGWLAKYKPE